MFAGNRRRSSNVKVMQLFHELKQQFPTVPDHIVTTCITSFLQSNSQGQDLNIADLLETALAENNSEQMGRLSQQLETPPLDQALIPDPQDDSAQLIGSHSESAILSSTSDERNRVEMIESDSDINRNLIKPSVPNPTPREPPKTIAKRPNKLDITSDCDAISDDKRKFNIQLSEKCRDVHKLLSSDLSEKPPRSPLSAKRFAAKNSPTKVEKSPLVSPDAQRRLQDDTRAPIVKKETCSTPTQTTDTLLGSPNLNLSLNVNLDLVQSPSQPRRTSLAQLTPTQPWLQTPATSPRSFTSVNLTLRPPTSTPQNPIDITSQNSSLTYSTSSFDSQKGLESRLQITVGPGGGSVASVRVRPKSYHPQEQQQQEVVPVRAGSLNDLAVSSQPPVILKQEARIERLRIELNTEKAKLVIMKQEVADLEKNRLEKLADIEMEKQLTMEIRHLRRQCKVLELDGEAFYNNIYTGPQGPLTFGSPPLLPPRLRPQTRSRLQYPGPHPADIEGPKWNCGICTFLNHPILDKCEQCEMPRIVHGTKPEAVNPNSLHLPGIIFTYTLHRDCQDGSHIRGYYRREEK
ncbi:TAK1-associated binding protein 2 isoform X2 [Leptinotarsa decemlineata]|uniref:TAK1-associated binding protein 2 isoform X2 n=1 Tax=Leptinotarsa decemlineata TaxID=7539 RepID=UPI003D30C737